MPTQLEMAETRLRLAVQEALDYGIDPSQVQTIVGEECINAVDYAKEEADEPAD